MGRIRILCSDITPPNAILLRSPNLMTRGGEYGFCPTIASQTRHQGGSTSAPLKAESDQHALLCRNAYKYRLMSVLVISFEMSFISLIKDLV